MRATQMNVRPEVSAWMDSRLGEEHSTVRIPKRARSHFQANGDRLVMRTDKGSCVLQIKQARHEDAARLAAQLQAGEITVAQANMTCFVTTETRNRICGRRRAKLEEFCYVTDGVDNLMIGADPEFVLVQPDTGRFQYAAQVNGMPGKEAELGHDGPLAELRPQPDTEVANVVERIRQILKTKANAIQGLDWRGGAFFGNTAFPNDRRVGIGGHIHIGDPSLLKEEVRSASHMRIIQLLDEVVALPLVRVDTPDPQLRRGPPGGGYGKYGDQRPQKGRFEWRVPSGLWLAHPTTAEAVLGATKAVAEAGYQLIAEHGFSTDWVSAPRSRAGLLKAWGALEEKTVEKVINAARPEGATPELITRAEEKLRSLPTYAKYQTAIDEFLSLVKMSEKDSARINLDLKNTWLDNGPVIKKEP